MGSISQNIINRELKELSNVVILVTIAIRTSQYEVKTMYDLMFCLPRPQ